MKVLVIGGSGFIGIRLVKALCDAGFQVRLLSRKECLVSEWCNDGLERAKGDLLDSAFDIRAAVAGCSIVFNCAGELSNENLMRSLHVDATRRIVRACKDLARGTGKALHYVQLSSVGAYGPSAGGSVAVRVITEESATAPVGVYESTKTEADEIIIAAQEKGVFTFSILRPSNVFGAGMPNNSIRQWGGVIKRGLFFYVGSRGAISTYVHVDDVVRALLLCGFNEHAKGEIFNISNDCTQEELVEAMAEALKVRAPTLRVPELLARAVCRIFSRVPGFPLSSTRIDSLVARTTYPVDKLARVLGYSHDRPVKDTISEVILSNNDGR